MGDMSGEPSMEHILSSIKRIIAEDGEATASERRERRAARMPLARPVEQNEQDEQDDVLELSEPMAETNQEEAETMAEMPEAFETDTRPQPAAAPAAELISPHAAAASKTSLDALSRLVVRPEVTGSDTLEGMVREMLKPMLAEWLDTNLPQIVDQQVAREIARITGR
jgi:uncharacterized protein